MATGSGAKVGRARLAARRLGGIASLGLSAQVARDQVQVTRHLFLASGVRLGAFGVLARPATTERIAEALGATERDRLVGWLDLGVTLGELRRTRRGYVVAGRRAKALAAGDELLEGWYAGVITFGVGIPVDLGPLLAGTADRDDLASSEASIAAISELADPLLRPAVGAALGASGATTVLDVGCGDGRLLAWILGRHPEVSATGVDQAGGAIAAAERRFARSPGAMPRLLHGWLDDVADLVGGGRGGAGGFGVVVSANAVYYRPPSELPALLAALAGLVAPGGELVVATAVVPDTTVGPAAGALGRPVQVGSAVLDLQLRCQPGGLRLPTALELDEALAATDLELVARTQLRTIPFVSLRARRP